MLALSIIAICISGLALGVAILAMLATRRNAAVAVRKELRELADRDDAEGPEFTADPAEVEDRKAKVKMRVVGGPGPGPGAVAVSVRPGAEWCRASRAESARRRTRCGSRRASRAMCSP